MTLYTFEYYRRLQVNETIVIEVKADTEEEAVEISQEVAEEYPYSETVVHRIYTPTRVVEDIEVTGSKLIETDDDKAA